MHLGTCCAHFHILADQRLITGEFARGFSDINWLHDLWQKAVMGSDLFDIHVQLPVLSVKTNSY